MALPPKPFHPLTEIATRWQVAELVIVGWAIEQRIALTTALPLTVAGDGRPAGGLVEIAGEDVFGLFGADTVPVANLRRFRRDAKAEWEAIVKPPEGVPVKASGVLIGRAEVDRFERAHRLFQSFAPPPAVEDQERKGGAPARYDWDSFAGAVARRVHERGLPGSQGELVRDMLDWFAVTYGATPDESTVRRRVQSAWRELTRP